METTIIANIDYWDNVSKMESTIIIVYRLHKPLYYFTAPHAKMKVHCKSVVLQNLNPLA